MQSFTVTEQTSARYTATLTDETGAGVAGSSLDTAILTLFDENTGEFLNNRDQQNVLNANGVTIDENGNLVWLIAPEDVAIITDATRYEKHRAVFVFTWSGTKQLVHELQMVVTHVETVP